MLIDLGVACAWIAMSIASAAGLAVFDRGGSAGPVARADDRVEPGHEDFYFLEALPAAGERWR